MSKKIRGLNCKHVVPVFYYIKKLKWFSLLDVSMTACLRLAVCTVRGIKYTAGHLNVFKSLLLTKAAFI